MNAKSLALSIFSSLSLIPLIGMAQPAAAEVSFEIISRSGNSSTELSNSVNSGSNFRSTPAVLEAALEEDKKENESQSDLGNFSEEEASNSTESSEDDFEGIVIRI